MYGATSADFAGVGKCCLNAEFLVATASGVEGVVEVSVISAACVHSITSVAIMETETRLVSSLECGVGALAS